MKSSRHHTHDAHEIPLFPLTDLEEFRNNIAISDEDASHLLSGNILSRNKIRHQSHLLSGFDLPLRQWFLSRRRRNPHLSRSCVCSKRSWLRRFIILSYSFLAIVVILTICGATVFPSYTYLPPHYEELKQCVSASTLRGRGNPRQEKIFIAASIYDPGGHLAGGDWAANILQLIHLLGPDNTFLSIYENDGGPEAEIALNRLEEKVPCSHSLVYEKHLSLDGLPHITAPNGSKRVKRIAYLAEVRNRALKPLDTTKIIYDKLLYLNDVVFEPIDVLQLLFSTNADEHGQAVYRAACAVDFIMPFKFYDTFATRDLGGFGMGLPFFPWFAYGGDPRSHQDVVSGKDAVRVKSCRGGLVAFDMKFFQRRAAIEMVTETAASQSPSNITAPYRFRAEKDLFWDASECCLIHADIQSLDPDSTGIFMNPFVRVAYDSNTLSWLWFTRRFERLYTPIHFLLDIVVSFPRHNPRRSEQTWEQVQENVWVPDLRLPLNGSFQSVPRFASHSGFCGRRNLAVMKETLTSGKKNYETVPTPS